MTLSRRTFLAGATGLAASASLSSPALGALPAGESHLVIGGGPKGFETALSLLTGSRRADVTLITPQPVDPVVYRSPLAPKAVKPALVRDFVSQGGHLRLGQVDGIDRAMGKAFLKNGTTRSVDQIHNHAGMTFRTQSFEGATALTDGKVLHGWTDHVQANQLWDQVVGLRPGGTMVITVPRGDIRFQEGPYIRANRVASYLRDHNPGAKVVVIDDNASQRSGMLLNLSNIEWVKGSLQAIQPDHKTVVTTAGVFTADILNVIPSQEPVSL